MRKFSWQKDVEMGGYRTLYDMLLEATPKRP